MDENNFNSKIKSWINAYKQIINYFPPIIPEFDDTEKLAKITGMSVLYIFLSSIHEMRLEQNLNFISSTINQMTNPNTTYSIHSLLTWICNLNIVDENNFITLTKEILFWYFGSETNISDDRKFSVLYSILNNTSVFNQRIKLEELQRKYLFETLRENDMKKATIDELAKALKPIAANNDIYVPKYFTEDRQNANALFTQPLADYYFDYKIKNIIPCKDIGEMERVRLTMARSFKFPAAVITKMNLLERIDFSIQRFTFIHSLANFIIQEYQDKQLEGFSREFVDNHIDSLNIFATNFLPNQYYKLLFFQHLINDIGAQAVASIFSLPTINTATKQWIEPILQELLPKPDFHPENLLSFMCDTRIPEQSPFQGFPHLFPIYRPFSQKVEEGLTLNNCQIISEFLTTHNISLNESKMLYLLVIYHNYFNTNSIEKLSPILQFFLSSEFNRLQCTLSEQAAFKAFIKPKDFMFQFNPNNNSEISKLFLPSATCKNDYWEIRHILVNILAVCLAMGPVCHLYTHIFNPRQIENTYGFGSTRCDSIIGRSVHYDCGCIIDQNGDLHIMSNYPNARHLSSTTAYIAYLQCYGAFILNCLFDTNCVENLLDPILAVHAVKDNNPFAKIYGESDYEKVVAFCFGRVISGYQHFLIGSKAESMNKEKISLLFNRFMERMYCVCSSADNHFKVKYHTVEDQFQAQDSFKEIYSFIRSEFDGFERDCIIYQEQRNFLFDIMNFKQKLPLSHSRLKSELVNSISLSNENCKILKDFLTQYHTSLCYSSQVVPILKLYDWLYNVYNTQVITDSLEVNLRNVLNRYEINRYPTLVHKARDIVKKGITAFNEYHKRVNGQLVLGACNRQNHFHPIDYDTSLSYLVNNQDKSSNILLTVITAILEPRKMFLDNCKAIKDDIISKHKISVQQLLINDSCLNLSQLDGDTLQNFAYSYSSLLTQEPFNLSFDLDQLQDYVINWYIKGHCHIDLSHLVNQTFYIHNPIEDEEGIKLPLEFTVVIPAQIADQIHFQLKKNRFPREEVFNAILTMENLSFTLEEFSHDRPFNDILVGNNNTTLLTKIGSIEEVTLKYFQEIYNLLKEYQDGDADQPFTNLSLTLRNKMNDLLEQATNAFLEEFLQEKPKEIILELITETFSLIQENLTYLEEQYNSSFKETMELLMSDNDLTSALPEELLCSHLHELTIILLLHRSNQLTNQLNDERKWREIEDNIVFVDLVTKPIEDDEISDIEEYNWQEDEILHNEIHSIEEEMIIETSYYDYVDDQDSYYKIEQNPISNDTVSETKDEESEGEESEDEESSSDESSLSDEEDIIQESNTEIDNKLEVSKLLEEEKSMKISLINTFPPEFKPDSSIITADTKGRIKIIFKENSVTKLTTHKMSSVLGVSKRWTKNDPIAVCNDWGEEVKQEGIFPYHVAHVVPQSQIYQLTVFFPKGEVNSNIVLCLNNCDTTSIKTIRNILHHSYNFTQPLLFHEHIYLDDGISLERLIQQSIHKIACYKEEDVHLFHLKTATNSLICTASIAPKEICCNLYWSTLLYLPLNINQYEEKDCILSSLDRPLDLQAEGEYILYEVSQFACFNFLSLSNSTFFSHYLPKKITVSLLKKLISNEEIAIYKGKEQLNNEHTFDQDGSNIELTFSNQFLSLTVVSENGEKVSSVPFFQTTILYNLLDDIPIENYFILADSALIKPRDLCLFPLSLNIMLINRNLPVDKITFAINSTKSSPFPNSFLAADIPTNISFPSYLADYSAIDTPEQINISFIFSRVPNCFIKHDILQPLLRYMSSYNLIQDQYLIYNSHIAFRSHFVCLNYMHNQIELDIGDAGEDFISVEFDVYLPTFLEQKSFKCKVKKDISQDSFLQSLSSLICIPPEELEIKIFDCEGESELEEKEMISIYDWSPEINSFFKVAFVENPKHSVEVEFEERKIRLPVFGEISEITVKEAINPAALHFGLTEFAENLIVKVPGTDEEIGLDETNLSDVGDFPLFVFQISQIK